MSKKNKKKPEDLFLKFLQELGACDEGVNWVKTKYVNNKPTTRTLLDSWNECNNFKWMLWCLFKAGFDKTLLFNYAMQCLSERVENPAEQQVLREVLNYQQQTVLLPKNHPLSSQVKPEFWMAMSLVNDMEDSFSYVYFICNWANKDSVNWLRSQKEVSEFVCAKSEELEKENNL